LGERGLPGRKRERAKDRIITIVRVKKKGVGE